MSESGLFRRLPLPVEGDLPGFAEATSWLNTEPLTTADLQGKVVLVDFWTYTCINWLRTLPYIHAWADAYAAEEFVVVGVHTPEFGVEHDIENVRRAVREMGITYPVAVDNGYGVWNAFGNQYWPALYIADAEGRIRHHHFGEGDYERSEAVLRHLLVEAASGDLPPDLAPAAARGIEIPADEHSLRSPETYVGYERSDGFASPEGAAFDEPREYTRPPSLRLNQWALAGNWTVSREAALSNGPGGRVAFRFHARDLHLILVPPPQRSARFRVLLDGRAPGDARGLDVDEHGDGVVQHPRLYQLIRQRGHITDREFEIEFLDPETAALCFTFG